MRCMLPLLVALGFLLLPGCGPGRPEHPNVILIVMDTTRADRTSLHGYPRPTTPYLEKLAAESTVYDDAWSPTSWTRPAHASLFTGLRPEHHGLLTGLREYLDERADTLAEILSRAGYETKGISCNPSIVSECGLTQGFDAFEHVTELPYRPASDSRRATSRALELLRQSRSRARPCFLFINHFLPHLPYTAPEDVARRFLPADATDAEIRDARNFHPPLTEVLSMVHRNFTPRKWAILSDLYDAEVATLDRELEIFVETLRETGALDESMLVIVGDHGENLGDHGLSGHVFSLHRSVRRVPMLIRYPDRFKPGSREGRIVRLEDIPPTILQLCGVPVPPSIDGLTLLDPTGDRPARAVLGGGLPPQARDGGYEEFIATQLWRPLRSVYDGRYHLIVRSDGREELYDVREDPDELRDLAGQKDVAAGRLRGLLPRDPFPD